MPAHARARPNTPHMPSKVLLLADIVLQARFCVCHVSFQVASHNRHLVEAVAEGVLRGVQALLRGCQILVGEVLGKEGPFYK